MMTAIAAAVRRNEWDRVALYLLVGVVKAAERLPPESLSELLALLEGDEDRREDRHGR
jgi:hypothetical protein